MKRKRIRWAASGRDSARSLRNGECGVQVVEPYSILVALNPQPPRPTRQEVVVAEFEESPAQEYLDGSRRGGAAVPTRLGAAAGASRGHAAYLGTYATVMDAERD